MNLDAPLLAPRESACSRCMNYCHSALTWPEKMLDKIVRKISEFGKALGGTTKAGKIVTGTVSLLTLTGVILRAMYISRTKIPYVTVTDIVVSISIYPMSSTIMRIQNLILSLPCNDKAYCCPCDVRPTRFDINIHKHPEWLIRASLIHTFIISSMIAIGSIKKPLIQTTDPGTIPLFIAFTALDILATAGITAMIKDIYPQSQRTPI